MPYPCRWPVGMYSQSYSHLPFTILPPFAPPTHRLAGCGVPAGVRAPHTAVATPQVYALGGYDANYAAQNCMEVLDTTTGVWSFVPANMTTTRCVLGGVGRAVP